MNKIIVGKIGAPYGVKGWSKVFSFTDPIQNILNYKHWYTQHHNEWQILALQGKKMQGNQVIIKLSESNDRDQAKSFINQLIAVDRDELPKLSEEEFYWADLIGLTVINLQSINLGTVKRLLATASNDILVVENTERRLIPYTSQVIQSVDLKNKLITVDWDPEF